MSAPAHGSTVDVKPNKEDAMFAHCPCYSIIGHVCWHKHSKHTQSIYMIAIEQLLTVANVSEVETNNHSH